MGLLSRAALKVAIVNIITGALFGYQLGFVAIYDTFTDINANCTHLDSQAACDSVKNAACTWVGPAPHLNHSRLFSGCQHRDFLDGIVCGLQRTETACKAIDACAFNHNAGICQHSVGWSATKIGIFAAAMIVGCVIGLFLIPHILDHLGRKRSLLLIGVVALLASVLQCIAHSINNYYLLVVARVIVGLACGASCVAGPMYVEEMAPENLRNQIGVFFQISISLGIVFVAAVGLALAPRDFNVDLRMELRFQIVLGVSVLISAIIIPIALAIPESTKWFPLSEHGEEDEAAKIALQAESVEVQDTNTISSCWKHNIVPLCAAVAMSVASQFTGINAVMTYAPKITKAAGLTPLVGNFVVGLWNFVTALASIPLAKRFPLRRMYLTATLIASLACLCTGISVYPGVVANDTAKHVLAGVGILVFIAAFEFGIGPPYFVLAQQLFPRSFRGTGSSFTLVVNNVFNVIINVSFPIAVVGLSGGKNGNQDQGMGLVFVAFGTMGALAFLVLFKTLRPSPDA